MAIDLTQGKITSAEIEENQLQGAKNPLTGNVSDNQAMFDRLPKKIAEKFNNFVDAVATEFDEKTTDADAHKNNQSNPHNVTAEQTGAYTKKQTEERLSVVEAVAKGRATGYVFDTKAALDEWLLNEENTKKLVLGDNFYIRDVSVPDYWWDAESSTACELETQKVDLSEYEKTENADRKIENLSGELDAHTENKQNPHEVTALQVGAYSKEEADSALDALSDILQAEISGKAEKGEVYTKGEADELLEEKVNKSDVYTKPETNELLDTKADKSTTYTKTETNNLLDKKANKEDVVSTYRFCGSVDTFDDLPLKYDLIPNGVPTYNGQVCGSYDEETHTVTIDNVHLVEVDSDRIVIPIVPINVKAGKYFTESVYYGNAYIGSLCTYACGAGGSTYETINEGIIDHIEIFTPYGEETISGSTNYLGDLPRIIDSWVNEYGYPAIPAGAYKNGAVYEVKDSGLNYGWTGSAWDALGTSHIDSEARERLAYMQEHINYVDSIASQALDYAEPAHYGVMDLEDRVSVMEEKINTIMESLNL